MGFHSEERLVPCHAWRERFVRCLRLPMLTVFACAGVACTATNAGMDPHQRWLDITAPRSGQEAEIAEARYEAWRLEANVGMGLSSTANSTFGFALGKRVTPAIELGLAFSQATYDAPEPIYFYSDLPEEVEQETALATVRFYLQEVNSWEPWLQVGYGKSWSEKDLGFYGGRTSTDDSATSISAGASYPLTDSITFEPSITNLQAVEDITTFQIALALNF